MIFLGKAGTICFSHQSQVLEKGYATLRFLSTGFRGFSQARFDCGELAELCLTNCASSSAFTVRQFFPFNLSRAARTCPRMSAWGGCGSTKVGCG